MRSTKAALLLVLGASLVLMTGCGDQLPEEVPDPIYLEGFLNNGWAAFEAGNYEEALDYFQQAIDAEVQNAEVYLGAGWSCLYLTDYWGKANDYFYMALQLDGGQPPLVDYLTEVGFQSVSGGQMTPYEVVDDRVTAGQIDTLGLLAESVDETWEDWPFPGDSTTIIEQTAGLYWYGDYAGTQHNLFFQVDSITGDTTWVGPHLGDTEVEYRFTPDNSGLLTCLELANVPLSINYSPDSISGEYVYLTIPMENTPVDEAPDFYQWIMPGMQCNYDYVTLGVGSGATQISKDAMAGWSLLQQLRGENGYPLMGVANGQALEQLFDSYTFDEGSQYGTDGVQMDIDLDQMVGNAALIAYGQEKYMYAWFLCKKVGAGTGLDPESADFELDLIEKIEGLVAG